MSISIVGVIVLLCVIALVWYILRILPLPPMVRTIAIVVLCLILIVWLLQLGGFNTGIRLN